MTMPTRIFNAFGQEQCHKCGYYSDIVFLVILRNAYGQWSSIYCNHCLAPPPGATIEEITEPPQQIIAKRVRKVAK